MSNKVVTIIIPPWLKLLLKLFEYATSDQESEGRELGIKTAANIYEPVLKNLEIRQEKIIAATDKEPSFFEGQAKSLREQCAEYEQKTAELAAIIKSRSEKKADIVDNILSSTTSSYSEGLARCMGNHIYNSWSLPDYLDKKMEEKREKFFKIEFEKQALVWQEKIKSVRAKIVESIRNLKSYKISNRAQLKHISDIVDDAVNEYCETLAKYNALIWIWQTEENWVA